MQNPHHQRIELIVFRANPVPEAVLGHPFGAGEMAVVDEDGALRLCLSIEAKKDLDHFFPAGAVGFCIEQPNI